MNIGIDKISLQTKDYSIKQFSNRIFGIKANMPPNSQGLPTYSDLSGQEIQANSVYHNGLYANYDINKKGLLISFNPSKVYHPYNLVSTGDELGNVIQNINSELAQIGILTSLETARVVRADITRNIQLDEPFQCYMQAFRLIRGKRQETKEYPDGYLVSNSLHQTCFYDKGKKLELDKENCIIPKNFGRGEVRAIKGKAVSRYFNFSTLGDLLETDEREITASYKTYLTEIIFNSKNTSEQMSIMFEDEISFFHKLKEKSSRGYFNEWLQVCSIDEIFRMFGSIKNLELFLRECGENRTNIHRFVKKINDIILVRGQLGNIRKQRTATEQLNEIQNKLIA